MLKLLSLLICYTFSVHIYFFCCRFLLWLFSELCSVSNSYSSNVTLTALARLLNSCASMCIGNRGACAREGGQWVVTLNSLNPKAFFLYEALLQSRHYTFFG